MDKAGVSQQAVSNGKVEMQSYTPPWDLEK